MNLHLRVAQFARRKAVAPFLLGGAMLLGASSVRGDLVAHWGLDELTNPSSDTTAQDYGPNELNGTYRPAGGVGGPIVGLPGATFDTGTAADFNGSTDEIFLGSPDAFKVGNNFTIAAWINPDVTPAGVTQRVFSQLTGAPSMGYGFGILGSELKFTTYGRLDYQSAATDSFTIPAGQWTHIAAVMGADNAVTFYQNGRFVTRITGPGPANANTAMRDYYIGSTGNNATPAAGERFTGLIDDVQFYNNALTQSAVKTIYGLPSTPSLVGHWKFDETASPSGNTPAADSSGNNFNGTYQPLAGPGPTLGSPAAPTLVGTSADFNGTTDEVFLASPLAFRMRNDFTIMAWINPDNVSDPGKTQRVFSQNGGGFGFGLIGNEFKFTTYGIKDYQGSTADGVTIPAGEWSHIAVVFDEENDAQFYLNGIFVEEIDGVNPANIGTTNFFIGSTGTSERFGGLIDDVRFYRGSLTAEQILEAAAIPEPSTVVLAALGMATLVGYRTRRKYKQ